MINRELFIYNLNSEIEMFYIINFIIYLLLIFDKTFIDIIYLYYDF